MASAKRGRVEQRKGWIGEFGISPGRKTIDWWNSFDSGTVLFPHTIGRPVAGINPGIQVDKFFCTNGIGLGVEDFQRIGRSIRIKSIRVQGRMIPPTNPSDIEASKAHWAKVSIIYDKKPEWSLIPEAGFTIREQAEIDSMRRWVQAWAVRNRAGTVGDQPYGYASSVFTKEEFIIIANETYELPPTYQRLDFGRGLASTVPEVITAIDGNNTFTVGLGENPRALGLTGFFDTYVMGEDVESPYSSVPITGTSTVSEQIAVPGSLGLVPVVQALGTAGAGTWGPGEISTLPGLPNSFTIGDRTFADVGASRMNIYTNCSHVYLTGPAMDPPTDPQTYKPILNQTFPTHVITSTSADVGDPITPTTGPERTMPIPLCSPTGLMFDIYRALDLEVDYRDIEGFDSYGPQQIVFGAIYVGIFTDFNIGWTWEGNARITFEDN